MPPAARRMSLSTLRKGLMAFGVSPKKRNSLRSVSYAIVALEMGAPLVRVHVARYQLSIFKWQLNGLERI
jgi:hypothetical protein